ncbi:MAG: AMP-binding protein, partial [Anaerolineales bacterium]|nr:AMP-binding protein [Anaerolineales bacterium]
QPDIFWRTLWDYFDLTYSGAPLPTLTQRTMPGAEWFPHVRLNYAENIFAQMTDQKPMMLYKAEDAPLVEISWAEVYEQVNRLAQVLRELGVEAGDRVVAYLPHIPQAIIALLATASIGAIWSSCSPDFGQRSVLDRYTQIEPKVLIAVDGYQYNGRVFDRRAVLADLQKNLPT